MNFSTSWGQKVMMAKSRQNGHSQVGAWNGFHNFTFSIYTPHTLQEEKANVPWSWIFRFRFEDKKEEDTVTKSPIANEKDHGVDFLLMDGIC